MPDKGKLTCSSRFERFSTGVFVKVDQLSRSALCCKAKPVEGTSQESVAVFSAGAMRILGDGRELEA